MLLLVWNLDSIYEIGYSYILTGCRIDDNVRIGSGCRILEGAHLESNSRLASGSVVEQGKTIPAGEVCYMNWLTNEIVLGW